MRCVWPRRSASCTSFCSPLDDAKHYWVGDDEIGKLERAGEGWLADHPERDLITRRYLLHQRALLETADAALEERPTPLSQHRADAVLAALADVGVHCVVDMGCGPGALLARLVKDRSFTKIVGVDVVGPVARAGGNWTPGPRPGIRRRTRTHRPSSRLVVYRDERLCGFDAMVLMEVIEHVDPSRLGALRDAVFASASPVRRRHDAQRGVQRALPRSAGGHVPPRRPPLRVDARRVPRVGRGGRRPARLRGRVPSRRATRDADLGAPTQLALFRKEVAA
ncbi:methyltransferase domain-containing protein [Microbacterium sp. MM2322]|uniref:methyltransferase domain-containing protein n=1 Tax=Microbacterium sp. MM2322 TaxID=3157631 RepID=UPI0032D58CD2